MTGDFSLPVAVDALVAVLLVVTIVYAVRLNRKLTALRSAKGEMEAVVAQLTLATAQAESGIQTLKAHANESGASLDSAVNRARGLIDELGFLVERGNNLADRLEGGLETSRGRGAGAAQSDKSQSPSAKANSKTDPAVTQMNAPPAAEVSPEETALLYALRGVR